ncbi:MAG: DUF4190 domain-containing protein [Chloroflexi bacterium]|nr:DUF4190 domain-containing protein [Chloroflexota bacterium]
MNSYYSDAPPYEPQNNQMALVSIIAGLGGWLFIILFMCLSFVIGALGALTFGFGSILGLCLIPVQCLIPIAWIVGIVTGHMALKQIKDGGDVEGGRGMAITGLISGYLGLGIICLLLLVFVVLIATGVSIPILEEILREYSQLWLLYVIT